MSIFNKLLDHIPIPVMVPVIQHYERPLIENFEETFLAKLNDSGFLDKVKKGMSIAITAGSRGVANQPLSIRLLVTELKKRGAEPFIPHKSRDQNYG